MNSNLAVITEPTFINADLGIYEVETIPSDLQSGPFRGKATVILDTVERVRSFRASDLYNPNGLTPAQEAHFNKNFTVVEFAKERGGRKRPDLVLPTPLSAIFSLRAPLVREGNVALLFATRNKIPAEDLAAASAPSGPVANDNKDNSFSLQKAARRWSIAAAALVSFVAVNIIAPDKVSKFEETIFGGSEVPNSQFDTNVTSGHMSVVVRDGRATVTLEDTNKHEHQASGFVHYKTVPGGGSLFRRLGAILTLDGGLNTAKQCELTREYDRVIAEALHTNGLDVDASVAGPSCATVLQRGPMVAVKKL